MRRIKWPLKRDVSVAPEILLSAVALCFGAALRFSHLDSLPFGLDIDEANILYWAKKATEARELRAYAPEFTRWEMLPGYFYHAVQALFGVPRLGPAILGMLEVAGVGWLAGSLLGKRAGWAAAALLALCPWHLYYSRIIGTCVGVSALALLALRVRSRGAALVHAGGLLYYATFRLVAFRMLAEAVWERRWRRALVVMTSLALVLGVVYALEGSVGLFFSRGSYNFDRVGVDWARNLYFSLRAPFLPVPQPYAQTTDLFMADYVHTGLVRTLGGIPPLGWALSGLTVAGLVSFALSRERRRVLTREALFLGGTGLAIGWLGPSLSRLLLVAPFLVVFGAAAVELARERVGRWAALALLATVLGASFSSSRELVARLGDLQRTEAIFHDRFRSLAAFVEREIPGAGPRSVTLISDYGFPAARYWADRSGKFSVLPPVSPNDLERILNYNSKWGPQFLLTDAVPEEAERLSGFDKRSRIAAAVARIEARTQIVQRREIRNGGRLLGHLLQVEWPYDLFGNASSGGYSVAKETW